MLRFSIIAVHGLGGHAMTTWTHDSTGKLWLRDFLPRTIPNARIMTFGYDSRVVGSKSVIGMMGNANNLLTQLSLLRGTYKVSEKSFHLPTMKLSGRRLIREIRPGPSSLLDIA